MASAKLQRNPDTGKCKRNPDTGKCLTARDDGGCCCGAPPECCTSLANKTLTITFTYETGTGCGCVTPEDGGLSNQVVSDASGTYVITRTFGPSDVVGVIGSSAGTSVIPEQFTIIDPRINVKFGIGGCTDDDPQDTYAFIYFAGGGGDEEFQFYIRISSGDGAFYFISSFSTIDDVTYDGCPFDGPLVLTNTLADCGNGQQVPGGTVTVTFTCS